MARLAAGLRAAVTSTRVFETGLYLHSPAAAISTSHGFGFQHPLTQQRGFSGSAAADSEARPPFPPFTFETAKEKVSRAMRLH